jgi:hypothetical protein
MDAEAGEQYRMSDCCIPTAGKGTGCGVPRPEWILATTRHLVATCSLFGFVALTSRTVKIEKVSEGQMNRRVIGSIT